MSDVVIEFVELTRALKGESSLFIVFGFES